MTTSAQHSPSTRGFDPLLQISNLTVAFNTDRGEIRPVQEVSLSVYPGQTLAVVGESGCGKSVTALSILRLIPSPPGRVVSGEIRLQGDDLLQMSEKKMQHIRGAEIAMIFQEPMTSLNPVYTIGDQITEAVTLHQHVTQRQARDIARAAMDDVGIADAARRLDEYPHQMSGGMRQRVMIAMALACKPKLLIADEPTTALDVTIQAQIMELLRKLQKQSNMAILLITHDLGLVAENADVVAVMYASRVVEYSPVEALFDRPQHPYTEGLFRAVPRLGERADRLQAIAGTVPNPAHFPQGCKFHPRCPRTRALASGTPPASAPVPAPASAEVVQISVDSARVSVMKICRDVEPLLKEGLPTHWSACHFAENAATARQTLPRSGHHREVSVDAISADAISADPSSVAQPDAKEARR